MRQDGIDEAEAFRRIRAASQKTGRTMRVVAEALIATAGGLFIAMLGVAFLNSLNNRVRHLVHQLETLKQMLINRFANAGGTDAKSNGSRAPMQLARTGTA